MTDNKIDGRFTIQRNNGITQGIANELGLSKQECKKIEGSIWAQIIQKFNNPENISVHNNKNSTPNADNNYLVHENAIVTFNKDCWNKIVSLINNALGKNIQVEEAEDVTDTQSIKETSELTSEQTQRKNEHETIVKQSIEMIKSNWDITGLGEHFKTPEDKALFLQCLDEIVYDADKKGAGHAENGIIHIETNNEQLKSKAEMTKLLIHEANHAFLERKATQNGTLNYPTKSEEIECETLGLTATAKLVNSGKIESFNEYGHPIGYYDSAEKVHSTQGFQDWLKGYNKLADNLNGDITIQHHPEANTKIPEGTIRLADNDSITINGKNYIITSEGKIVSGSNTGKIEQINSDCTVMIRGKLYKLSVNDLSLTELEDNSSVTIKGGNTLTIEGFPSINIGTDAMLEGIDNTSITQLIFHHKDFSRPDILGTIIFDDMQPTDKEKELAGFHPQNNGVRFTITKADGSKITGTCYPNTEVLRLHLKDLDK